MKSPSSEDDGEITERYLRMITPEILPSRSGSSYDLMYSTAWESEPAGRCSDGTCATRTMSSPRESHLKRYSCDETGPVVGKTNQTDKPAVLPCTQWNLNEHSRLPALALCPCLLPSQNFHIAFSRGSTFRFKRRLRWQRHIHLVVEKGEITLARRAPMASIRECPWEKCSSSLLCRSSSIITYAVIACVVSSSSSSSSSPTLVNLLATTWCLNAVYRFVLSFRCHSLNLDHNNVCSGTYSQLRRKRKKNSACVIRGERKENRMIQGGVRNGERGGIRKVAKRSVALDCLSMKLIREKRSRRSRSYLRLIAANSLATLWRDLFPINSLINNHRQLIR